MNQDNKSYMNHIWHEIRIQEKQEELKRKKTTMQKIKILSNIIFLVLITSCALFIPDFLKGGTSFIGLMILSSVTYSEYKKLKGAPYDY